MKKKCTLLSQFLLAMFLSGILFSCGEDVPPVEEGTEVENQTEEPSTSIVDEDAVVGNVVKFKGEIFSIPSPIQSAILLREAEVEYNPTVLNDTKEVKNYVSQYQKALNLGAYGADLAYVSSYQNTQTILEYFMTINSLTDDLNIKSDMGNSLIERFGGNMDNLDSLYVLNAEIYKTANQYLKESDRNEVASLILTGGWVEALNITMNVTDQSEIIKARIGEQQSALNSLINLLSEYEDEMVQEIVTHLNDIKVDFDGLGYSYAYNDPIHDKVNKTTHLKSVASVEISDVQLASIKEKIKNLRTLIIS